MKITLLSQYEKSLCHAMVFSKLTVLPVLTLAFTHIVIEFKVLMIIY